MAEFRFIWPDKLDRPKYPTIYITLGVLPSHHRAMTKIPVAFLSHASMILASTSHGLSGSKIVQFCNAWAADHGVDTPHAVYPFDAPNKRTALLENLRAFTPEVQYQMILDLCDLAGSNRPEVEDIRQKLVEGFRDAFDDPSSRPRAVMKDPYVLEFLGISGAGSYDNVTAPGASRKLVIFLCHASEDKAPARHLYKLLRSDGYAPWLDEEDLLPGQEWEIEIPRAVRQADVVLVCLSHRSNAKTGYVQREIRIALDAAEEQPDGAIYIIPLRLEDCQVPERLTKWQWVDTFADNGYERLCRSLNVLKGRGS